MLLSDLGDTTYLAALNADSAKGLYADAVTALINIQLASRPGILPDYDSQAAGAADTAAAGGAPQAQETPSLETGTGVTLDGRSANAVAAINRMNGE